MSSVKLELDDISAQSLLTSTSSILNPISTPVPNGNNVHDRPSISQADKNKSHLKSTSAKIKIFFKQFKLVLKSVGPDLKSMKSWHILILVFYALFNFIFTILDFNFLIMPNSKRSLFRWTNDVNNGLPLWRRLLLCLSGLSAFTNVLNVVLVIHGKMSSYFWGILGAILYGSYAFAYGYVGDAQLSLFFYLPMQFVGIFIWSKSLDEKSTTRVKSLTCAGWFLTITLSVILIYLFFYEIPFFSIYFTSKYVFQDDFYPHLLDAMTNGLSVIGQFLLILRYWEQYIIWTTVNLMLIVMYSGLLKTPIDINQLLVWIMFTGNSTIGMYTWYNRWRNGKDSR